MNVNRLTIKFFIEDADTYEITAVIPVFHRWIREDAVPGLLIDVADYKHVPDGPGIMLIGHEVDYALDEANGRRGFFVRRKHIQEGALAENLQQTLAWALTAVQQFASDTGLRVQTNEVEIAFPDRLHVPNSDETFASIQEDVTAVLQNSLGTEEVELTNSSVDTRRPLTITATSANAPALSKLNEVAIAA